jgi:hypothetical protein
MTTNNPRIGKYPTIQGEEMPRKYTEERRWEVGEVMSNMFDDIFAQAFTDATASALEQIEAHPETKTLDPIEDLQGGVTRRIPYERSVKNNPKSAFMKMTRRDLNWLGLLLESLIRVNSSFAVDIMVLEGKSTAKRARYDGNKAQTWREFVSELSEDKHRQNQDYSEGQLRHLPALLLLLSTHGKRMAKHGVVEFYDKATGEVLV